MKKHLESKIKERITRSGPISFADFMEMALYDPENGYYATPGIGQDFYTSPSAHPVFGALLAIQLEEIWFLLGKPDPFTVVELGAALGTLEKDIKDYSLYLSPGFIETIDYIPVEKHQGKIPDIPIEGCFISNEFMDALPVHIVVKKDGDLKEVMVGIQDDILIETLGEPLPGVAEHLAGELDSETKNIPLPEGYRTEVNLDTPHWITTMAKSLKRGIVITIDYGYPASELYSPGRQRGSLLCYYQHTYNEEPLKRVGCQDITSHVDFTTLIRVGEKSGLTFNGLLTQREFLNNLGIQHFILALSGLDLSPSEHQANLYAMQDIIRPDGIGSFRVLLQSKGIDGAKFKGLQGSIDSIYKPPVMVPRLRKEHLPLYQAKYSLSDQVIEDAFELWTRNSV